MTNSDWALVGATFALVMATVLLALSSWALYKVTQQLSMIEQRRDKEEARRARRRRVAKKLELAQEVIHMSPESLANLVISGGFPNGEATVIRNLHLLIDYGSDQVQKGDMDRLLLALDGASRRVKYDKDSINNLKRPLKTVQDRLGRDLFGWRNQLVDLSPEVE